MEQQFNFQQTPVQVSQPINPPPVSPRKKHTILWLIAGFIVFLIGIAVGTFLRF